MVSKTLQKDAGKTFINWLKVTLVYSFVFVGITFASMYNGKGVLNTITSFLIIIMAAFAIQPSEHACKWLKIERPNRRIR
jgi:hypothetical protein